MPSGRSSAGSSDLLSSVMARPTPFDLVFAHTAETVFPVVRAALERGGHDPTDRDAFLMVPEVVSLLHDLRDHQESVAVGWIVTAPLQRGADHGEHGLGGVGEDQVERGGSGHHGR